LIQEGNEEMNRSEIDSFIAREKKENRGGLQKKTYSGKDFTTGENGTISGYFATFDHDKGDSYGDVIKKGAFAGTIARRKESGHPFPMCFNHDFSVIIGRVTDIGEDDKGAYFTAEFFPTEKAQEIRNIIKSGVLWQFSFAFDILESGNTKLEDGTVARELRELELYEISIVMVPANPRATVTDIKSGRRSQNRELLRMIAGIKAEQDIKKESLLRSIGKETNLAKLKKMEAQALKDIGEAEIKGKPEWKERRKKALAAIRHRISVIENR